MLRVHSGGVNTTVPVSSIDLRLDNTAGQTLETTACTSSFGSCSGPLSKTAHEGARSCIRHQRQSSMPLERTANLCI